MKICKAPTLRLKTLNKHTQIMYIEMEFFSSITMPSCHCKCLCDYNFIYRYIIATLGTRRVHKRCLNGIIDIIRQITSGGAPPEYIVNTSVVLVLSGYSKGARKVSGKCIKCTPGVLRGCLQGTRLSITARDYFSWITSHR